MKFSSSLTNRANNENKIKRIPDEWLNYILPIFFYLLYLTRCMEQ